MYDRSDEHMLVMKLVNDAKFEPFRDSHPYTGNDLSKKLRILDELCEHP